MQVHQELPTSTFLIRRLILCGPCVSIIWSSGEQRNVTTVLKQTVPDLVFMVRRGISPGDAITCDPDIVLGHYRPDLCLGMRHHSPLFTELGGVGTVPISTSARLGSIGRILTVPLGMRKFDIRAVCS